MIIGLTVGIPVGFFTLCFVLAFLLMHCNDKKKKRSNNDRVRTPSSRPRLIPTVSAIPAPSVTPSSRTSNETSKSTVYQPTLPTAPLEQVQYELQPVHRESHFTCQDLPPTYEAALAYPPTAPAQVYMDIFFGVLG